MTERAHTHFEHGDGWQAGPTPEQLDEMERLCNLPLNKAIWVKLPPDSQVLDHEKQPVDGPSSVFVAHRISAVNHAGYWLANDETGRSAFVGFAAQVEPRTIEREPTTYFGE